MNIAIVDDEKIELETAETFLRYYVKKFYPGFERDINIEVFQRVEEFLQIFNPGLYNVIILSAHMEGVANFIRAQGDCDTKIIFLKLNDDCCGGGVEIYEHCYR